MFSRKKKAVDAKPARKRRRWPFWLLAALVVLVGGAFFAHRLWGDANERRLMRLVDELEKAGEPVSPSDLNPGRVPDDRNAAVLLSRAAAGVQSAGPTWDRFTKLNLHLPLTDTERETTAAVLATHAQSLKSARDARGRPEFLGQAVGRQPVMITTLSAIGIQSMAVRALAEMAPTLRIDSADDRAADPEQLRTLIAELLDDAPLQRATLQSLRAERVGQLDTILCVVDGRLPLNMLATPMRPTFGVGVMAYGIRPMLFEDAVLMLRHMTTAIDAAGRAANLPRYRKLAPKDLDRASRDPFRHMMVAILLPSLDRFMEGRFVHVTRRRLAATALAIRWYAVEHEGKLPATLEELVPRYLPAVPDDALADAGPVRYLTDAADPRAYSVGEDGVDDGGSDQIAMEGEFRRRPRDLVVHLVSRPRTGENTPTPENELPPLSTTVPASAPTTLPE